MISLIIAVLTFVAMQASQPEQPTPPPTHKAPASISMKKPEAPQPASPPQETPAETPPTSSTPATPAKVAKPPAPAAVASPRLGGGGYPAEWANAPINSIMDTWYMWNRQCVSYTAFKVQATYGYGVYGYGDANTWTSKANNLGFTVSATPKVGAVGIQQNAEHGHSVWVERVSGGYVTVSQYNANKDGLYSVTTEPASNYTYIYFGERRQ